MCGGSVPRFPSPFQESIFTTSIKQFTMEHQVFNPILKSLAMRAQAIMDIQQKHYRDGFSRSVSKYNDRRMEKAIRVRNHFIRLDLESRGL